MQKNTDDNNQADSGFDPSKNEGYEHTISISLPKDFKVISDEDAKKNQDEVVIDLLDVARRLWTSRSTIIKYVAIAAILGVFYALLSPKEYRSTASLMPEYEAGSGSSANRLLSQYGSLLGISGGTYSSNSNAIRVTLYPNIVQSSGYQLELMYTPFYFSDIDSTVTLYEYFTELREPGILSYVTGYTIGLPKKILGFILNLVKSEEEEVNLFDRADDSVSESKILMLTKSETEIIQMLRQKIFASLDEETGIVSVSVLMPDDQGAANVAEYAIELLTEYLVDYRVGKELNDLQFIEEQLEEATQRFENAQEALAAFREQYRGNLSVRSQTEEQKLQSDYQVAFGLYNTLTQQREQAKLKVQEQTPIFKTLEPVQIPKDDESSGFVILFVFVTLGGMAALAKILLGDKIKSLKNSIIS